MAREVDIIVNGHVLASHEIKQKAVISVDVPKAILEEETMKVELSFKKLKNQKGGKREKSLQLQSVQLLPAGH
jgi:hypothetical protein